MQYDRDVSIKGHCVSGMINFGDQEPQKFVLGHIVLGRPITSPYFLHRHDYVCKIIKLSLALPQHIQAVSVQSLKV